MNTLFKYISLFLVCFIFSSVTAKADFRAGWEAYLAGDYATALKECKPLAEQGNADAQSVLGMMYSQGEGVPQDQVLAYMWWNISAAKGYKPSINAKDILQKKMLQSQIAEAQKLSREWIDKHR